MSGEATVSIAAMTVSLVAHAGSATMILKTPMSVVAPTVGQIGLDSELVACLLVNSWLGRG